MIHRAAKLTFLAASLHALVACDGTEPSGQFAPLDYASNPHSAKYDFGQVDEVVNGFMVDYPSVEGVTLAIVRGTEGQIYEAGYGFEPRRISAIASTGKVLSAGVILSLVDDGLLDLDRPIADYLDWGDHHPDVTMRQLLSMMGGLPHLAWYEDQCVPFACECDPAAQLEECGQTVYQDELHWVAPMEQFRYSRWQLAGAVAEVVSQKRWATLVEEKLIQPCGLPHTGYRIGYPEYPEDFRGDPSNIPDTDNPSIGAGAYSNVNDYSKVLLMHLREGSCGAERVLSSDMVRAMQADSVPEGVTLPIWRPHATNYGMGWWKHEDEPGLLIDSGAFGARSLLHPDDDWGAIFIMEDESVHGTELRKRLVPVIRAAIAAAEEDSRRSDARHQQTR